MNNIICKLLNKNNIFEIIFPIDKDEKLTINKSNYLSNGTLDTIKSIEMQNGNKSIYETFNEYDCNGNNIKISTIKRENNKNKKIIPKKFHNKIDREFQYDIKNRITNIYKNGNKTDSYSYTSTNKVTHIHYADNGATINKIIIDKNNEIVKKISYDDNGDEVFYYSITVRRGFKTIIQRENKNGILTELRYKYKILKDNSILLTEFSEISKHFGVIIFKKISTKIEYNDDNSKCYEEYFIERINQNNNKQRDKYSVYYSYNKNKLKFIEYKINDIVVNCDEYNTWQNYDLFKSYNTTYISKKLNVSNDKFTDLEFYCSINSSMQIEVLSINKKIKDGGEFTYNCTFFNSSNILFNTLKEQSLVKEKIKYHYKNICFILNGSNINDNINPENIIINIFDINTGSLLEEYDYTPRSEKGINLYKDLRNDILSRNEKIISSFKNDIERYIKEVR